MTAITKASFPHQIKIASYFAESSIRKANSWKSHHVSLFFAWGITRIMRTCSLLWRKENKSYHSDETHAFLIIEHLPPLHPSFSSKPVHDLSLMDCDCMYYTIYIILNIPCNTFKHFYTSPSTNSLFFSTNDLCF